MIRSTDDGRIKVIGVGIYTVQEAARLAQVPTMTLRRWLRGYRFPTKWSGGESPPMFRAELPEVDGHLALGFLDLVEVLFIKAFKGRGLALQTIRRAARKAADLWETDHPFCIRRLKTDGRSVFATIESEEGHEGLLDLAKSQWEFESVIDPYLTQVDYDGVDGRASRWWPLGKRSRVVVDPRFSFGRPIVLPSQVPTEDIFAAVKAEESERKVARWFGIPLACVRAAIEFEESRAA